MGLFSHLLTDTRSRAKGGIEASQRKIKWQGLKRNRGKEEIEESSTEKKLIKMRQQEEKESARCGSRDRIQT